MLLAVQLHGQEEVGRVAIASHAHIAMWITINSHDTRKQARNLHLCSGASWSGRGTQGALVKKWITNHDAKTRPGRNGQSSTEQSRQAQGAVADLTSSPDSTLYYLSALHRR